MPLRLFAAVAVLGATLAGCSSEKSQNGPGSSGGGWTSSSSGATSSSSGAASSSSGAASSSGGAASSSGGGGSTFAACIGALTPLCKSRELDTAEKLRASCGAIEYLQIPLTSGGAYGPQILPGGPYGGKIEWNQGAGTAFVNAVNVGELICNPIGIDTFLEPAAVTDDLKNTRGLDSTLYTIFRPACLKQGERYPVITWANGTCGYTHGYAALLGTLASHGFVIVASNSTWTATSPTDQVQLRALDYAKALDEDPQSVLHGKLDLGNIGAMGHSQGAMATATAAKDPRVKAVIFWNTGTSSDKPFLDVSGDRDVGSSTASSLKTATESATQPGAWVYYHQVLQTGGTSTGHLVLMEQPDRVWELTVAWWKWHLKGDLEAKKLFVGETCGLCGRASEIEYGHNSLLQ